MLQCRVAQATVVCVATATRSKQKQKAFTGSHCALGVDAVFHGPLTPGDDLVAKLAVGTRLRAR